jgi:AcrR family transcriptional regulator
MSLAEHPARRRLSGPARRASVLRAGLVSFATNGYAGTAMGDIADRAGVTRAVVYDHFPSKKALYLAALDAQRALFLGHVGAAITSDGAPGTRMRSTMEAVFAFADRYPDAWRLLFTSSRNGDPDVDAAWEEMSRSLTSGVAELLADDLARRGIDPDDERGLILVDMLVGALTAAVERSRRQRGTPQGALVEAGMTLMWTGLRRSD